jgi:gliding motility-associated protein GldL
MGKKQESKADYIYRVVVPKVTSVGASVVIVGALFKIMHWPYAGAMLTAGLLTEAFLFFIGAFQPAPPPEAHYDWEKVYPELAESAPGKKLPLRKDDSEKEKKALAAMGGIDKMLAEANLGGDVFKSFGTGMKKLNESVTQMKDVSSVATASNQYTQGLQEATKSMKNLNNAYSSTVDAMNQMASTTKDTKEYHAQVQVITKNLGALNAVYEMELKDANSHLKAMNKFYSNLTVAMESMSDASKESKLFKDQMSQLTTNLTTLNKVYGNMLTAMKG